MQQSFRPSSLVPFGFAVDRVVNDGTSMVIIVHAVSRLSACPGCGSRSERARSCYRRGLADPPISGRPVWLVVVARRFHCDAVLCRRRIFTERFDGGVVAPRARRAKRTGRLDHVVYHLRLALCGRPPASFARRLMLPVSNDTLLRVVHRLGSL